MLVPFPFTDLSGRKRRPALVVSPEGFHEEDLILCAVTSRVPERPSAWEVPLEPGDVIDRPLPKRSVVKVGKLFTMHRRLVTSTFGSVEGHKLSEVLGRLRVLFADETRGPDRVEVEAAEGRLRTEEVDETVLALLHMNAFEEKSGWRAWKNLDRDAMDRLRDKGLIGGPQSRARSVVLTDEGRRLAEEAFRRRFAG